jgi:hypothetical protein
VNPAGRYQVSLPGATTDLLRRLLRRAVELGVRERLSAALAAIDSRLRTDPVGWGDPVRHYARARVTAYRRIHDELLVEYSVHDDRPEVWLLDVVPILSHPLRED